LQALLGTLGGTLISVEQELNEQRRIISPLQPQSILSANWPYPVNSIFNLAPRCCLTAPYCCAVSKIAGAILLYGRAPIMVWTTGALKPGRR
jgi:hypothetical protein